MLKEAEIRAASDLIWQYWRVGRRMPELPEEIRPATRAEGYAIQALLERRSAGPPVGWKIAATSTAGQRHIGVDGPLAGRLLAEQVLPNGAEVSLTANLMRVAEPEFAFRMARTLLSRAALYTEWECWTRWARCTCDRDARFALHRLRQGRGGAAHRGQRVRAPVGARSGGTGGLAGHGPRGASRDRFCLW